MIRPFEFYYDFASPYTYLAHKEIIKIETANSIEINYKPVLLGGLFKLVGNKANANIPVKAKYMIKDCKMWAEKNNIFFKFNSYFPIITLNLMRCAILAEKIKVSKNFINLIFDAIWKDNLNLNDETIIKQLLEKNKIGSENFLSESIEPQIKNELKVRTLSAFEKGIFGTPTFLVNNKIFWGQDRLEFALKEAEK